MKILNQTIWPFFYLFLLVIFACELEKIPDANTLADFDYGLDTNDFPPIDVTFTNKSINADTYHWDFGDTVSGINNTSNEENTEHTYNVAGYYNVTLTATQSETGTSSSFTTKVNINCITFRKVYDRINNQKIVDLVEKSDSGFAMVGYGNYGSTDNQDILLYLCDKNGTLSDPITFGSVDKTEEAYGIALTPTNGFAIVGYTQDSVSDKKNVYIIRTDSTGNMLEEITYGDSNSDQVGNSILVTHDSRLIVAGYIRNQQSSSQTDILLLQRHISGGNLSEKTYENPGSWEKATDIVQNGSNGFIVLGHKYETYPPGHRDYFLLFTKEDLTADTTIRYPYSNSFDISNTIVEYHDGFALLGYSTGDHNNWNDGKIKILFTDKSGNEISSPINDLDGYRYRPGWAHGIVNTGIGFATTGSHDTDIYFTQIDYTGSEIESAKTYDNHGNQYGYAIIKTSDGGFAIAGYTDEGGDNDALLIKTDPDGNIN